MAAKIGHEETKRRHADSDVASFTTGSYTIAYTSMINERYNKHIFHLLFLSLSCVILKVRHNETVLEKRKYFIAYSLIQVQNLISFYK